VNTTNVNRTKNSRLFTSGILTRKNLENEPANAILLYIKIVYAALNIIELLAKTPINGNLSNIPYKDINSPTKFKVRGTPQLPNDSIKNKIENIGIN
jgi:hypothetical protein